jgi:hypothetical protein
MLLAHRERVCIELLLTGVISGHRESRPTYTVWLAPSVLFGFNDLIWLA